MYYALWNNMTNTWDDPFGHGIGPLLYPTYKMARKKLGERTSGKYYFARIDIGTERKQFLFKGKLLDERFEPCYTIKEVYLEEVTSEDC